MVNMIQTNEMMSLRSKLADWWRNWRNRCEAVSDFDCCGADEVERVARDVGVSSAELRTMAGKWPGAADLLRQRMAHLDLDSSEVTQTQPFIMRDLQRSCTLCQSKRQCMRDLGRDPDNPAWQDYCPNAMTLKALLSQPASKVVS
jgi:hypothetical protein